MTVTAMRVYSDTHGLVGVADKVVIAQETVTPIETKKGRKRTRHAANELQVAAQALCLREMFGRSALRGYIYYAASKERVEVPITSVLIANVLRHAEAIRSQRRGLVLPAPQLTARCRECSMRRTCMPEFAAPA